MSRFERPVLPILAGALAAAAMVVGAFVVIGQQRGDQLRQTSEAGTQSVATDSATTQASATQDATVPIYYVVDTEHAGVRLVREFQRVQGDPLTGALELMVSGEARDPDYRSLWPAGGFAAATYDPEADRIEIELKDDGWRTPAAGMDSRAAELALQQAVYTAQGVVQKRAPVEFTLGGKPTTVFGIKTAGGLTREGFSALNHINLTTPEQGQVVTAGALRVSGVGNSFEATVKWELRDASGAVVREGSETMAGWQEERLFPFAFTVDVSQLPQGNYRIWTSTDDPAGGAEGFGAMTDDKEFIISETATPSESMTIIPLD